MISLKKKKWNEGRKEGKGMGKGKKKEGKKEKNGKEIRREEQM